MRAAIIGQFSLVILHYDFISFNSVYDLYSLLTFNPFNLP